MKLIAWIPEVLLLCKNSTLRTARVSGLPKWEPVQRALARDKAFLSFQVSQGTTGPACAMRIPGIPQQVRPCGLDALGLLAKAPLPCKGMWNNSPKPLKTAKMVIILHTLRVQVGFNLFLKLLWGVAGTTILNSFHLTSPAESCRSLP